MLRTSTPESRFKARVEARAVGVSQRDLESHLGAVAAHVGAYVIKHRATPYVVVAGFLTALGYATNLIESIKL